MATYERERASGLRIRLQGAQRLVQDLMMALYFDSLAPFDDPEIVPQFTTDYAQVCQWLADNKGRGLMLFGSVGNGKTLMIKTIIPTLIHNAYRRNINYSTAVDLPPHDAREDRDRRYLLAIDDLGTEDMRNDYGNISYPFNRIIDHVDQNGGLLLASSNLLPEELRAKYGERTFDRILRHFKFIKFGGKSLRNEPKLLSDLTSAERERLERKRGEYLAIKAKDSAETNASERAKAYAENLRQWRERNAAKEGMSVEEWMNTRARDVDYLERLWKLDCQAGKSNSFFVWLKSHAVYRDEFYKRSGQIYSVLIKLAKNLAR